MMQLSKKKVNKLILIFAGITYSVVVCSLLAEVFGNKPPKSNMELLSESLLWEAVQGYYKAK